MSDAGSTPDLIVHASCVAVAGRAALIQGAAGSGKSTLALMLMAFGAKLVADDRVCLCAGSEGIDASAPATIAGLIEARGIGVLCAERVDKARLALVIDLDRTEAERIPPPRGTIVLGRSFDLLYKVDGPHFAPAIYQYLSAGRHDPP